MKPPGVRPALYYISITRVSYTLDRIPAIDHHVNTRCPPIHYTLFLFLFMRFCAMNEEKKN